MARNSGSGGALFFGLLGIIWLMSKCGSDENTLATLPTPPSEQTTLSATVAEQPDVLFVQTARLNERSQPSGAIVGKLSRGDSVSVYERQGGWARISPQGAEPRWVSNSLLCSGSDCASPAPRPARSGWPTESKRSKTRYVDDNCPCSGGRVCIGPRGGRFCITSGGNKRYGV